MHLDGRYDLPYGVLDRQGCYIFMGAWYGFEWLSPWVFQGEMPFVIYLFIYLFGVCTSLWSCSNVWYQRVEKLLWDRPPTLLLVFFGLWLLFLVTGRTGGGSPWVDWTLDAIFSLSVYNQNGLLLLHRYFYHQYLERWNVWTCPCLCSDFG